MPKAISAFANALLRFFADKLPISRWQRDLTDSTVLRNVGVALGHTLIGWRALQRGLAKLAPDPDRMAQDLEGAWEVLGEAMQTVLRAAGVPDGYELLKSFTRGQRIDAAALAQFIEQLAARARPSASAWLHCGRRIMLDWPRNLAAAASPTDDQNPLARSQSARRKA